MSKKNCGIYKIECGICNKVYIEQKKRFNGTRLEKRLVSCRQGRLESFSVAQRKRYGT